MYVHKTKHVLLIMNSCVDTSRKRERVHYYGGMVVPESESGVVFGVHKINSNICVKFKYLSPDVLLVLLLCTLRRVVCNCTWTCDYHSLVIQPGGSDIIIYVDLRLTLILCTHPHTHPTHTHSLHSQMGGGSHISKTDEESALNQILQKTAK